MTSPPDWIFSFSYMDILLDGFDTPLCQKPRAMIALLARIVPCFVRKIKYRS